MALASSDGVTGRVEGGRRFVFVSYGRADDEPPPGRSKTRGFVQHLWRLLVWELTNLGVPKNVLWADQWELRPADDFNEVIREAVSRSEILMAVISPNFVRSEYCQREITLFAERIAALQEELRRRRIFRVDKYEVPDQQIPDTLRGVQAVLFYEKDPNTGDVHEFYRGKVLRRSRYDSAVHELAVAIFARLRELGLHPVAPRPAAAPVAAPGPRFNGRTLYVAKPAGDVRDAYETLVRELEGRGFRVVPDPRLELPAEGAGAERAVREALATAEGAIHLVGEEEGPRIEGQGACIVPFQLAESKREALARPRFERLIWVPKAVPGGAVEAGERRPLEVIDRLGGQLATDEIVGDTAAGFNLFVLQRLQGSSSPAVRPRRPTVYVSWPAADQKLGQEVVRQVIASGALPIYAAGGAGADAARQAQLLGRADHALVCWGAADEASILDALDTPAFQGWRETRPGSRLILFAGAPASPTKEVACAVGHFGSADVVIDSIDKLRALVARPS